MEQTADSRLVVVVQVKDCYFDIVLVPFEGQVHMVFRGWIEVYLEVKTLSNFYVIGVLVKSCSVRHSERVAISLWAT